MKKSHPIFKRRRKKIPTIKQTFNHYFLFVEKVKKKIKVI